MQHANTSRWRSDQGSASIEFIALAMLVLVPLWYVILVLGQVQAGVLAAEGAARHAARMFTLANSVEEGRRVAGETVRLAVQDFEIAASSTSWSVSCVPSCTATDGVVEVTVGATIPVPLAPSFLESFSNIPVTATAAAPLSRFGGR